MKTTLLQNNHSVQIVLTPETEWEKKALAAIPDTDFVVRRGSFFAECTGGWQREYEDDESLMFVSYKVKEKVK